MNMASPGSHKSPHITPSASALTVSADNIRLKMMENYCADRVSPSCDDGNPAFLIDIDLFRAVPSVPSITRGQHFTFVVCVSPDFASKLPFLFSSPLWVHLVNLVILAILVNLVMLVVTVSFIFDILELPAFWKYTMWWVLKSILYLYLSLYLSLCVSFSLSLSSLMSSSFQWCIICIIWF